MTSRCEECKGRREYLGMGGMPKPCKSCGGTGWVSPVALDKRSKEYRELKKQQEA